MTLYQLECFIQVAELLSFVKAAEKMCISQPAITYQIRSLEKEMDVLLFERNTRHCRLTMAGQTFYYDAVQLLSFSSHAVKKAQEIHQTNRAHFKIGIRKLFDYDRLAQLVEEFYEFYPYAEVDVLSSSDAKPLDELRTGRVDAGFFYSSEHQDTTDIIFEDLYEMNYYVLVHPKHPWASKEYVEMSMLKGQPLITAGTSANYLTAIQSQIIPEFIKSGIDLGHSASSFEGAMIMTRSGKGILVIPLLESTVLQGMVKIPLKNSPSLQVQIGWMNKDNRKEIPKLIELAKKIYESSGSL